MKSFLLLLMAAVLLSCTASKTSQKNTTHLNGTWIPIQQEMGGNALPESYFKSQRLVIQDNAYSVTAESTDKGTLRYEKNGQMDIYSTEGVNQGKHFTALYKLENNLLTIVYNLKGDSYPTSYNTKLSPMLFMAVYKKG